MRKDNTSTPRQSSLKQLKTPPNPLWSIIRLIIRHDTRPDNMVAQFGQRRQYALVHVQPRGARVCRDEAEDVKEGCFEGLHFVENCGGGEGG